MTELSALWMPIVLSAVLVFLASSVLHMASPWHKTDYPRYRDEDQVLDALRPLAIPPGDYFMPRAPSAKDMNSPEFIAKMERGPIVLMTVMPNGRVNMGRSLSLWFVYSLVIAFFAAYVASRALGTGVSYLQVFRFVGVTVFLSYAAALWHVSIWYFRAWSLTIKATVDALIYACLMAGAFGWLWPR
jgi:hypothetical protein